VQTKEIAMKFRIKDQGKDYTSVIIEDDTSPVRSMIISIHGVLVSSYIDDDKTFIMSLEDLQKVGATSLDSIVHIVDMYMREMVTCRALMN
jgi:hypothetical protein